MQKWLRGTGILAQPMPVAMECAQRYRLQLKPQQSGWIDAHAEQVITARPPSFVWDVKMKMAGVLPVYGRDLFQHGNGSMHIAALGWLHMVKESNHEKINEGMALRFPGEMVWMPRVALQPYITWEPGNDSLSANATITVGSLKCIGIFRFREIGDFGQCDNEQYRGMEAGAQRTTWSVKAVNQRNVEGIRIPTVCNATWWLEEGPWTWAKVEVVKLTYHPQKKAHPSNLDN